MSSRPYHPTSAVIALLAEGVQATDTSITVADATDPGFPLVYVNAAFETLTGYSASQVLGRNSRFPQGPATSPEAVEHLAEALRSGQPAQARRLSHRADGSTWWNEMHLSPTRDRTGALTHVLGIQHDVTGEVAPLTGLANRLGFIDQPERDLARVGRDERAIAVLFLDIDDFNDVIDADGDAVPVEVASRLRGRLRGEDLARRPGGDEFLVLLVDPSGDGTAAASTVLTELARALAEPFGSAGPARRVGVSLGLSAFPRDGKTSDELIAAADRDLYRHTALRRRTATHRPPRSRPRDEGQLTALCPRSRRPRPDVALCLSTGCSWARAGGARTRCTSRRQR